jgi:hypothetical protein
MPSSAQCGSGMNGYSVTIPQALSAFLRRRIIIRRSATERSAIRSAPERRSAIPDDSDCRNIRQSLNRAYRTVR